LIVAVIFSMVSPEIVGSTGISRRLRAPSAKHDGI
jgi:hypothetical protein